MIPFSVSSKRDDVFTVSLYVFRNLPNPPPFSNINAIAKSAGVYLTASNMSV